jgi:hypothetical protein
MPVICHRSSVIVEASVNKQQATVNPSQSSVMVAASVNKQQATVNLTRSSVISHQSSKQHLTAIISS